MSISTIHARESAGRIVGRLRQTAIALAAAVLAACGGGDAAGPAPSAACGANECGTALVTMTDAPGDFVSYAVDITSLQLRRANGTEVETLPVTTRIDFTELVDLDEVLSAGQVPYGSYVAATLRLDFANAEILVEGETGEPVEVSPVDGAGQPLGAVELDVQLDGRGQLAVSPGQIARLAFDLNLAASNTVNLAAGTVTVSPFVVASVVPQAEREARVRGRLASVDVAAGTYTIDVRPFKLRTQVLGQLVVHTTSSTSFEINGEVFSGSAGIAQLATLVADRPMVIAFGTFAPATHVFTAQRVLAGTSGEDPRRDLLSGNVIAREGNALVVSGVRLDRRDGRSGFERGRVTLTVGPDTRVTRAGQSGGTYDIDDISVGQRIHARGDLSGSSTGGFTLDATAGAVRMDFTRLFGTVTARTVGNLTLALRSIDGRPATLFDFAGTGSSMALDADPAAYEVATSVLALPGIAADSYTRVLGFVTPFGLAPPDFQAVSVLDFAEARAALGIDWTPGGSTTPFVTLATDALTVDLVDPALHGGAITVGGRLVRLGALTTGLVLAPAAESRLLFAIAHRATGRIENFATFADFSARLGTVLAGGTPMLKLVADGRFDAVTGTFRARQLLVVLAD